MAVISGSVRFAGFVAPTDSTDTYPVTDPKWGLGGLRNVYDSTERDAITSQRRESGMLVYVASEQQYYTLGSGLTNSDWSAMNWNQTIWSSSTGTNSIIANNGTGNLASGNFTMAAGSGNTVSGTNSAVLGGSGMTNPFNNTLMTMNARLAENNGVIYSAGTDLYNIFLTSGSLTGNTTSSNGLTKSGDNITLGGSLTADTYINNSGFLFRTNQFSAETINVSNLSGANEIDVWRNIIIQNGIVIEAENGGSQIDLRPSSTDGAWQITSDSGAYGNGSAWIYSQQSNGVQIALGNGSGAASFADRAMGLGIYPEGYAALNGNAFNITIQLNNILKANSANLDNPAIFVGSKNSTINSGILNSVIIGGQNITGTTSDTVFMPKINLASTTEAQIIMQPIIVASPVDGSMWFTTSGGTTVLNYQVSGVTKSVELT